MTVLAFDTSNYTTSVALITDKRVFSVEKLLQVPEGALGLRQQDALFQHVKELPALLEALKAKTGDFLFSQIKAIGVSTKPRETEDSYMPCFRAGESLARSMATVLRVPCFPWSHQQGHMAAAAYALNQVYLLEKPFLSWHISGGTTELLYIKPKDSYIEGHILGGTSDISAGQLLDRTGQRLEYLFPSGKFLDQDAMKGQGTLQPYSVKIHDFHFSLSGMENKIQNYVESGEEKEEIARFTLDTIGYALGKVTALAKNRFGKDLPVVYCGGVASSQRLKTILPEGLFPPLYTTDNAVGVAVLTQRSLNTT